MLAGEWCVGKRECGRRLRHAVALKQRAFAWGLGTPRGVERPCHGSLSPLPALHPAHPTCHPPADTACHPSLSPLPVGPSVLVAPVLKQGAQSVDVFLPGGGWWFDGTTGNWVNAGKL